MGRRCQQLMDIVLGNLQKDPKHYEKIIQGEKGGADVTACSATATALAESLAVTGTIESLPFVPFATCEKNIRKALAEDKIVAIGISPDHHFILLPLLSGTELALLQAFQSRTRGDGSGISLFDWIDFEKYRMPVDAFLISFRYMMCGGSVDVRKGVAGSIFSMSGKEEYVGDYFKTAPSFKYCAALEPVTA